MTIDEHASASTQVLGQAHFLDLLGDAYNGLGRYDEAIVALSEAAGGFRRHGAHCAHAVCLFKIAQSHLALGRRELAIGYLEECLPAFRELHLPDHEREAVAALNDCRGAQAGRPDPAGGQAGQAGQNSTDMKVATSVNPTRR